MASLEPNVQKYQLMFLLSPLHGGIIQWLPRDRTLRKAPHERTDAPCGSVAQGSQLLLVA
jgi:hypothetical protein